MKTNESELYKELGRLTRDKPRWQESIPGVSSLLTHESVRIQAKALWLLGEMGLAYPQSVHDAVPAIASLLDSPEPLLRERALNALGRIGRGSYPVIEPYWAGLFRFAADEEPKVRLALIWASENIATNTPDIYQDHMPAFAALLNDADDRVRMEAPEIFRVLGKRRPEFVRPYLELLKKRAETDGNRVVRIHCLGAVRAAEAQQISSFSEESMAEQKGRLLAACGNDCSACPRYTAYPFVKTEEELHRTAELWMRIGYRDHVVPVQEIACTGCKPENWCRYHIVKCCEDRGIRTCAECPEYPCANMKVCFEVTGSFEPKCREVCTDEEYQQLRKAFFEKEKNLSAAASDPVGGME